VEITANISLSGKIFWYLWDRREVPGTEDGLAIVFSFGGLSKREALQRIDEVLKQNGMEWLKPIGTAMGDWVLDFDKMKVCLNSFEVLQSTNWFQGKARITPECETEAGRDVPSTSSELAKVRFIVTQEELISESLLNAPSELIPFVECFCKDHPVTRRCAFIMMRFDKTPLHERIVKTIKETCLRYEIEALRADDKWYADDLLPNVRTYMHGCEFGIAIFERLTEQNFNPNVSLEVGYMMALRKPICYLKDSTLASLQSDLAGNLYIEFDTQRPEETVPPVLEKWLKDKGIITA
jgi:hypothetical protein